MRLAIISGALLAAGCVGAPTADDSQPANRVCGVDECFYRRDVRNFEVIERTTLIVYVGRERCPYRIELRGTFCDLSFAPEIYFIGPGDVVRENDVNTFGSSASDGLHELRICRNDINVGVTGGAITENPTVDQPRGRYGTQRSDCMISSVEALTDDQLIELYVRRGVVAPPPPMGPAKIQVGDQEAAVPSPSAEAPVDPQPALGAPEAASTQLAKDAATAEHGAN